MIHKTHQAYSCRNANNEGRQCCYKLSAIHYLGMSNEDPFPPGGFRLVPTTIVPGYSVSIPSPVTISSAEQIKSASCLKFLAGTRATVACVSSEDAIRHLQPSASCPLTSLLS